MASVVPSALRRERLVILQPVELAGLEGARRHRRAHHDLDDGGRQPDRPRARSARSSSSRRAISAAGATADGGWRASIRLTHRIALLGARHRLHDVAGEGRMQIAEEADGAAVRPHAHQHVRRRRLGDALGRHRLPVLVEGLEIACRRARRAADPRAPSTVLGCVPAATRIVRAGSTTSSGGAPGSVSAAAWEDSRSARAWPNRSSCDLVRRQALGEADALLQRLRHFLVVQRVARRIDQAAAIGDGDAAPAVAAARRCAARGPRARPLRARRGSRGRARGTRRRSRASCVGPAGAHRGLAALGDQRLVAAEEFLDLHADNRRATRSRCRSRSGRRRSRRPAGAPADWRCCRSWRRR